MDFNDPVFQSFKFYSCLLAVKMMVMSLLTVFWRYRKGVYANEEDTKLAVGEVAFDDPEVERVRRAHRNDMENIPMFWVVGAVFASTGPAEALAVNLFRVYFVCRLLHTVVYAVLPLPQPARGVFFAVPYLITWYMGMYAVVKCLSGI